MGGNLKNHCKLYDCKVKILEFDRAYVSHMKGFVDQEHRADQKVQEVSEKGG